MFQFLLSRPDNERDEIYNIITAENITPRDLRGIRRYFTENGFPNSETYVMFQEFIRDSLGIELVISIDNSRIIENREVTDENREVTDEQIDKEIRNIN